ncbi:MAG TPA: hypothetical protein VGG82_07955 [Casimicrobiaceae bacterium]
MDLLIVAFSLALPLALGASALLVLDWPRPGDAGAAALRCGYGYIVGALLLTSWMRGLSLLDLRFSRMFISLPLLAVTAALIAWAARRGRVSLPAIRSALTALVSPSVVGWQRVIWIALIAWLVAHFALMAAEVAWRPLYPWDAWVQWATKARVWYELGHIAPFVRGDVWLAGADGAYFDASPNYPGTVPLLQVWTCMALGRWDDSAMNWPWLAILAALVAAVYGALRGEGVAPLSALFGAYLLASLPLVDVHVALAGYADLPMGAVYTLAAIAFNRWAMRGDMRDAVMALLLAGACPLIKAPGWIWAATLIPGVVIVLLPRRGARIVGVGFAVAALALLTLARTEPMLLGYRLHLNFAPAWAQLVKSYYLMGNWNLLWYAVIALVAFGWRHLMKPPLLPLTAVTAAGLGFLFFVFAFTDAAAWLADLTTANRATLHIVPLLVFLGVLTWHSMTLAPAKIGPSLAVATP